MNPVTYVTERFQFGDEHKIYFLYEDNDKRLWVGMCEMGIKSSVSLLYRLSPFMLPTQILFWLSHNKCLMQFQFGDEHKIYFLYEDNDKRLWVGMWDSGLKWFDRKFCISQKTEPLVEMGIKSSVSLLYRLSPFMLPTQILLSYQQHIVHHESCHLCYRAFSIR